MQANIMESVHSLYPGDKGVGHPSILIKKLREYKVCWANLNPAYIEHLFNIESWNIVIIKPMFIKGHNFLMGHSGLSLIIIVFYLWLVSWGLRVIAQFNFNFNFNLCLVCIQCESTCLWNHFNFLSVFKISEGWVSSQLSEAVSWCF